MKMTYLLEIYDKRHSSSFLLMLGLSLLCYNGGKCLVVERLETSDGGDAVLPCVTELNVDATDLAVEWSRPDIPPDQYVHFQRDGKAVNDAKNPPYEGRTSLFMDELKKGNVSLKLSRVTQSDGGIYTCYVPEINRKCTVQVIVVSMSADGVSEDMPRSVDEHKPDEELSPVETFPRWGLIAPGIIIIIIIIIVGVLGLTNRQSHLLELGRKFCRIEKPADTKDRSMNGVCVDKPQGVKIVDGTSTPLM